MVLVTLHWVSQGPHGPGLYCNKIIFYYGSPDNYVTTKNDKLAYMLQIESLEYDLAGNAMIYLLPFLVLEILVSVLWEMGANPQISAFWSRFHT